MITSITLDEKLYKRVMERARAENMTPDEWLSQTATLRLEREKAGGRLLRFATKNGSDMAALGVTEADISLEIQAHRLGR
jgi:hypothetical protein